MKRPCCAAVVGVRAGDKSATRARWTWQKVDARHSGCVELALASWKHAHVSLSVPMRWTRLTKMMRRHESRVPTNEKLRVNARHSML